MRKVFQFIVNPLFRPKRIPDISSSGNFWSNLKKQFAHNRLGVFSLRFLYFFILIALLADILANEKPLMAKKDGAVYFPVFRSYAVDLGIAQWQKELMNIDWKNFQFDFAIFPPVPYSPSDLDMDNVHSVSPFGEQHVTSLRWRHWLGTDELGRDVLSGMIHGTRTALTVGIVAMGIAALFGILIGALAGYFGDERLKISRAGVVINILFFFLAIFWGFIARSYEITDALSVSFGRFFLQILFSVFIMAATMFAGNVV